MQPNKKKTTEEFIRDAIKIHGNKYDYSKVEYITAHIRVEIICPIHGPFYKTPHNHYMDQGCPLCSRSSYNNNSRSHRNKTNFINKVGEKFSDKYDLSEMEYKDCKTPIKIICNIHGEFYKTPESFLDGRGCPLCNQYGGRNRRYAKHEWVMFAGSRTCILYLVKLYDENETFLKIGITAQSSIKKILKQCKPKYMGDVICFATGNASFIFDKEVELQRLFKDHKYHPLKKFGGYTECYDMSMLNEIRNIFDEINSA